MFAALTEVGIGGTFVHRGVCGDGLELVELIGLHVVELLETYEPHLGEFEACILIHALGKVARTEVTT